MADPTPIPAGWPHAGPDEFGPYLAEQLKDPEVRAAYEAERAEQTPIPADPLAMPLNDEPHAPSLRQVRDLGRTQWGSYIDATEDDGFHDDPRYVAACRAADMVPLLVDALDRAVAAGRTAAAEDPADVDLSIAEGRLAAVGEVADWLGSLRGRTDAGQVYADLAELKLRAALGQHKPDGPCDCRACPAAARVAENGADR